MALFALVAALVIQLARPVYAAESTTGLIVGAITSETGLPLDGVNVSAVSPSGRYSAVTDARGRF
jgi:hypothetical protein